MPQVFVPHSQNLPLASQALQRDLLARTLFCTTTPPGTNLQVYAQLRVVQFGIMQSNVQLRGITLMPRGH